LFGAIVILGEAGTRDTFKIDMVREDAIKAEAMPNATPQEIPEDGATGMGAPAVHAATIGADEDGLRLDRALAAVMNGLSRSRLKTLILAGHVAIGGRTICDPSHRVNAGDPVTVVVPQAAPAEPLAEDIPLAIVYEDDDIIVIDKPRGLVVHPAAGNWTGTLVNALVAHCGASLSGIGGVRRPGIVHRLDKDTTGLMVVAKNDAAHRSLAAQFADHGRTGPLQRGYLAFVWGAPDRLRGVIDRPIDRHRTVRDRMAVRPDGREALTVWEVVERYPAAKTQDSGKRGNKADVFAPAVASLLDCQLRTGRTHQIRVHLASIGHPLLGDDTYGPGFRTKAALLAEPAKAALETLSRQALHAYLLVVMHPATGQKMEFRSELPPDLAQLRLALGNG
jgi:23S rRNA pseudouridine1911/1915/1917 synthase